MANSGKIAGILLIFLSLVVSCARSPQGPVAEGELPVLDLVQTDVIPSEWGRLVSAVISPDFPRRVQLWFQDEKGDVRLAFYEMNQRKLAPKVVVFSRS